MEFVKLVHHEAVLGSRINKVRVRAISSIVLVIYTCRCTRRFTILTTMVSRWASEVSPGDSSGNVACHVIGAHERYVLGIRPSGEVRRTLSMRWSLLR